MLRARDDERRAGFDDLGRLVEDDLDAARIGFARRELDAPASDGSIPFERDDTPFDLRDRLLRDDDDVAVLEVDALDDRAGEVVSLAQLRQARDGRDGEAAHVVGQAGDADAGVAFVALVEADDQAGQTLEDASARERACVERAAGDCFARELERERLRVGVVAADEGVFVRTAFRELRGGERLETGDDRAGEKLLRPFREGEVLGRAEIARDAQYRRRADRVGEGGGGFERCRGVRREHDEFDSGDGVLVRGPSRGADLLGLLLRARRVARAEDDLVSRLDETLREREAEVSGTADDRDLHAGTAPNATSARRRRASSSLISVRVTIGRTSPKPSRSSASASSTTIASIKPV